jgi:hypothetical protein
MHKREGGRPQTYPVVFRTDGRTPTAGGLTVSEEGLLFLGGTARRQRRLIVPLADVVEVHIARLPAERLNGHSTFVLERQRRSPIQVAPLGAGLLHEIFDLLIALTSEERSRSDRLAVSVPLKAGCLPQAQKLLALGPPVDPSALALTSHEVYLREGEAVFVFRGPNARARIGKAMRTPALWRASVNWQDCIAGPPRIHTPTDTPPNKSTLAYSWTAK